MASQEKTKLTLRINARLVAQAKQFASQHDTSVSQLVETFFQDLASETDAPTEHSPLVQQLTGLLPADFDAEQAYHDYLLEKHG
jgi:antitoxin component of RelBE/YafQ-DinJ toxin-antitoxin module